MDAEIIQKASVHVSIIQIIVLVNTRCIAGLCINPRHGILGTINEK